MSDSPTSAPAAATAAQTDPSNGGSVGAHYGTPPSHTVSGQLPPQDLGRILDVQVEVTVELGRRRLTIAEVLALAPNAVLELFKRADESLDIRVNGRLVARGEAVVLGERYGVRITELVTPQAAASVADNFLHRC